MANLFFGEAFPIKKCVNWAAAGRYAGSGLQGSAASAAVVQDGLREPAPGRDAAAVSCQIVPLLLGAAVLWVYEGESRRAQALPPVLVALRRPPPRLGRRSARARARARSLGLCSTA